MIVIFIGEGILASRVFEKVLRCPVAHWDVKIWAILAQTVKTAWANIVDALPLTQ